jgi:hypothetical protein
MERAGQPPKTRLPLNLRHIGIDAGGMQIELAVTEQGRVESEENHLLQHRIVFRRACFGSIAAQPGKQIVDLLMVEGLRLASAYILEKSWQIRHDYGSSPKSGPWTILPARTGRDQRIPL